jgi:hypothetical protein
MYDDNYPKRKISKDNPYMCCAFCGISAPEINGRLERHSEHCSYRIAKEEEAKRSSETFDLVFILKSILNDLPQKRDWLDPELEQMARDVVEKYS